MTLQESSPLNMSDISQLAASAQLKNGLSSALVPDIDVRQLRL